MISDDATTAYGGKVDATAANNRVVFDSYSRHENYERPSFIKNT
jgi:hypothetical protein